MDLLLLRPLILHQLLAALIEGKVIQDGSLANMLLEYLEHLKALFKMYLNDQQKKRISVRCHHFCKPVNLSQDDAYLLCVTAIRDRLVLIVL